ncbi:MAG TPA: hypothetical protein VF546_02160 [Pyrinomonadaceae bacterium]
MQESESITQTLPRLKADIRIAPFQDGGAQGERYLVEVGDTCFVAGAAMRDVLTALQAEPETLSELAEIYQRQTGREVSTETLAEVLSERIPESLFSHTPAPANKKPFAVSVDLIPERWIRPLSQGLAFLFARPLVVFFVLAFVGAEYLVLTKSLLVFRHHRYHLWDLPLFYLAIVATTFFHELGHAAACRRYDCPHGKIGFGLYFIYPAFYTDVTKAWRLSPRERAVIDLGGVYFQAILFSVLTVYVLYSRSRFALHLLWAMNFMMLFTLNPIFKMDGYWLLSDLSGLTNLHQQMGDELMRVGRKLLRRPGGEPAPVRGARRKLLYAYSALVVLYYSYIIHILSQSFHWVVKYYPQRVGYFFYHMGRAHQTGHNLFILIIVRDLVMESIWPFIFACALFFMGRRIVRLLRAGLRLAFARKTDADSSTADVKEIQAVQG